MKCTCEECRGEGQIPCPECDGQGTYDGPIEKIQLISTMHNYQELRALQKDAGRAIRQAAQLKKLNPARADSYQAQLDGTLVVINGLAEKAAKKMLL